MFRSRRPYYDDYYNYNGYGNRRYRNRGLGRRYNGQYYDDTYGGYYGRRGGNTLLGMLCGADDDSVYYDGINHGNYDYGTYADQYNNYYGGNNGYYGNGYMTTRAPNYYY